MKEKHGKGRVLMKGGFGTFKSRAAWAAALMLLFCMAGPALPVQAEGMNQYDESHELIVYNGWTEFQVSGGYGPTVHSAAGVGSAMQVTFQDCTCIELYGGFGSNRGHLDVWVDGQFQQSIDTYHAAMTMNQLLFRIDGLKKGEHTLKAVISEKKNPASTSTWVEVDRVASDGKIVKKEMEIRDPEEGNQIIDDDGLSYKGSWTHYTMLEQSRGFYRNTATSTQASGVSASYTFAYCTGIRWYSTVASHYGVADVYLDGKKVQTVDVGALPASLPRAVFDSGELEPGEHSIMIVKAGQDQDKWLEIDRLIGVGENLAGYCVVHADNENFFTVTDGETKDGILTLTEPGQCVMFAFCGPKAELIGEADATVRVTVDGLNKGEAALKQTKLLDLHDLSDEMHFVRLELVRGTLEIHRAHIESAESVFKRLSDQANAELAVMESGGKEVIDPQTWHPVSKSAVMPLNGVTLDGGILKTAFDRNIAYLKHCGVRKMYVDQESIWTTDLTASTEGRMMAGIGNTLRFVQDEELESILDRILSDIKARTGEDGWCMPYSEKNYQQHPGSMIDEDRNYDRVMFTRGLAAAGKAGRRDALEILRNFYDWFDQSDCLPTLLRGGMGTQGSLGTILAYESPVGKPEDLAVNMKYYDMDWWLEALAKRIPEAIYRFPLNRPHSYLLVSVQSFLAQYAATGEQKYLDAVLGAWDIFNDYYRNVGGGICICEGPIYKPANYTLDTEHGVYENCGHVFWIELNARLLELFPQEEKYAAQIEETLYNMLLASQAEDGRIRYFQLYNGSKYAAGAFNTCCENMASGMFGALPQYVWSVAEDGIRVNLYAASTIHAAVGGEQADLSMETDFPYANGVAVRFNRGFQKAVYLRIPSWNPGDVEIYRNGQKIGTGKAGSYYKLEGPFAQGDEIAFRLDPQCEFRPYTGETTVEGKDRYALTYGPILMAAQGGLNFTHALSSGKTAQTIRFNCSKEELEAALVKGEGLEFTAADYRAKFVPYMTIQNQTFAVFPVFEIKTEVQPTPGGTPEPTASVTPTPGGTEPPSDAGGTPGLVWGIAAAAALAAVTAAVLPRRLKKTKK